MSFANIEIALQTQLASAVTVPIYWPNTEQAPQLAASYVRPTLLPAGTELYTLSSFKKFKGIYQVDIYVPLNIGSRTAYQLADAIKTSFEGNRTLTANGQNVLIQAVSMGKTERQDAWFHTFVEINYLSYN